MSPQQQLAYARQQAQAALLPHTQANARARTQAQEDARNNAIAHQAAYGALAKLQAGIAPQIGDTYSDAADRQAAYGAGFSKQVGDTLDSSAEAANALLAANGSPQHVAAQGQSAKDILYALGGYNPATVLNQQGAAFESAAKNLPAMSTGLGVDAAKAARNQGQVTVRDLLGKLADIQAQRPGMINQALTGVQQQQRGLYSDFQTAQDRKTQLQMETAAYGLDYKKFLAQQARLDHQEKTDLSKPDASLSRASGAFVNSQGQYLTDSKGNLRLLPGYTVKGGQIVKRGTAHARSIPRLTAKQTQDYRGQAATIASNARNGFTTVDKQGNKVDHPALSYRDALSEMEKAGIPTVIAVKAVNKLYAPDRTFKAKKPTKGDLGVTVYTPGDRH